ncbi:Hypothetical protein NTJ_12442 [Nesidiocoris tenuis]|uniref:Uncharacterized protein n=1 Tax=Nesidiocoris tenuis TaxID=355587 RepID=A0ABN7B5D6_9HEMI|nr:Hypothetical protein NTJ_12442 [Nesidiocoris tenuis]
MRGRGARVRRVLGAQQSTGRLFSARCPPSTPQVSNMVSAGDMMYSRVASLLNGAKAFSSGKRRTME